jgi:hypothetical protein
MRKNICFVSLSYNHEKFILLHFESIKYQIEKYSKNLVDLIYIDDNSKDDTFKIGEQWVKKNRNLFDKVQIIKNSTNLANVGNYLKAINLIKECKYERFKILSTDDLFGPFNIIDFLEGLDEKTLTFTPTIRLIKDKVYISKNIINYSKSYTHNALAKKLSKGNFIEAPGAFISIDLINKEDYFSYLRDYYILEDYSSWIYLSNNKSIPFRFISIPFVFYRTNYDKNYHNTLEIKSKKYKLDRLKIESSINFLEHTSEPKPKTLNLIKSLLSFIKYKRIFQKHLNYLQALIK